MGYRRPLLSPVYTGDLEGLEVKARRLNMEQMLTLVEMGNLDLTDKKAALGLMGSLHDVLADVLISWNYEDENGEPVPLTREALAKQDFDFLVGVGTGLTTQSRPDDELGKDSANGDRSVEASLTMVPLSESQAS